MWRETFSNIHAQQKNSPSYLDHRVPINKFPTRKRWFHSWNEQYLQRIERIPPPNLRQQEEEEIYIFTTTDWRLLRPCQTPALRNPVLDNVDSARVTSAIHKLLGVHIRPEGKETTARRRRRRKRGHASGGTTTGPINGPNESIIHS